MWYGRFLPLNKYCVAWKLFQVLPDESSLSANDDTSSVDLNNAGSERDTGTSCSSGRMSAVDTSYNNWAFLKVRPQLDEGGGLLFPSCCTSEGFTLFALLLLVCSWPWSRSSLPLHPYSFCSSVLKMEVVGSSETLVMIQQDYMAYIPECSCHCEDIRSKIFVILFTLFRMAKTRSKLAEVAMFPDSVCGRCLISSLAGRWMSWLSGFMVFLSSHRQIPLG
jgi:hypothetical protein